MKKQGFGVLGLCAAGALVSGCASSKMNMEEMMQAPSRPAELDALNAFTGTWSASWECTMEGMPEPMKGTGMSVVAWECDKWVMLERFTGSMGEDKFQGIGMWSYDPKSGKYQMRWMDSFGGVGDGTATYDAATRTWTMKGKGSGMQDSVMEGTMRFVDDNTMEWTHTEWNSWKTKKTMSMKGTSRKQ